MNRGWIALGLVAQLIFSARFVVQWLASERARASVVPVSFWYLSLLGSALLLAYALHRRDPVFVLGQGAGFFIYLRNLHLLGADRPQRSGSGGDGPSGPTVDGARGEGKVGTE